MGHLRTDAQLRSAIIDMANHLLVKAFYPEHYEQYKQECCVKPAPQQRAVLESEGG